MELTILKDIVIIFALSVVVNLLFTKLKVPTVVGYLFTGIIAGPHLLKLISAQHEIELMAEIGVVLLMFTIGIEFSLKHLLRIRRLVFLGGAIQVGLTAGAFFVASLFYDLPWQSGLFIGFLAALSSSALVLKILQERSELSSNYGRTVLGILIFQDLLLVPLLLVTNMLKDGVTDFTGEMLILSVKVVLIIAFVYVGNKWLFPKLLHFIALAKSQELFLMSVFLICFGIALLTSELGMSLAFGAFLAGLMIAESEYSHNAFSDIIPLKDTFTSFFFVSVGMLLDLQFLADNFWIVSLSVIMIIGVKTIVASGTGFLMGHTLRGTVMVGLALSQVGEFSFILAKIGLEADLIPDYYYQLFLAVAVITISLSPFVIQLGKPIGDLLLKLPLPKFWVEGLFPLQESPLPEMKNHLVVIGKDISASKLSVMASYMNMPHVSIVFDPVLVRERQKKGESVVYGDAVNEPVLRKAHVDTADIVSISVGNLVAAMAIVEKVRHMNKHAYIIVRVASISDIGDFYELGANQVVPEKFEVAVDMFSYVLSRRLLPKREINRVLAQIRSDHYGIFREKDEKGLSHVLDGLPNVEISALRVDPQSQAVGQCPISLMLRKRVGVTLLALKRGDEIIEHPDPNIKFEDNDIAYVLGKPEQISNAIELFAKNSDQTPMASIGGTI